MVAMYTDIATEGTPAVCPADWKRLALIASQYCTCLMISDLYHSLRTQRHKAAESLAGPLCLIGQAYKISTISSLRAKFISAA